VRSVLVVAAVVAVVGVIALRRNAPVRALLVVGAVVAIVGGIALHRYLLDEPAFDFTINRVAAQRLLDGKDLYDRDASRPRIAADLPGEPLGSGPYFTYIGPPSTALVHVPWARLGFASARASFEAVQFLLMLAAVLITGFAVPRSRRPAVWLVGLAALPFFFPVGWSLGQVDGFVMVALAVAIWASVRKRWYVLGAALGFAALLKISPWLVLGFMLLRAGRHWRRVALGAVATVGILLLASAVIGRAGDLGTWVTDVAPDLARGTRSVENQSLPALIERLFTASDNIVDTGIELWTIRFLGYALGVVGMFGLWWWRRQTPFDPLELELVILIALVSGPLSWVHYLSWAVLVLMMLADPARYDLKQLQSRLVLTLVLAGTALMAFRLRFPSPEQVAENWLYRPYSGIGTVALVLYATASLLLLTRQPSHPGADTQAKPLGAPGTNR
jgi:Glycosyltransferase family 87